MFIWKFPPARITINVGASDADGTVAKVEFFQGVTNLGEDTTTPYSYVWSNVAAGSYQLTAKATDNQGAISNSSTVNVTVSAAVPPQPTGLTATAGNAQVSLAWTAPSGATSYNMKRATVSGGPYTTVAPGVTLTTYTDTGLTNGTTYYYVVSATNASGESPNSTQVSAIPRNSNNNPPSTPTITEPSTDGQIVHPADVHMEASPFSEPDPGDTHVCTDWEIWTITPSERVWVTSCIGGVERTHTHLGDGVFENSHAGRTELMYDTDYRLRARHKDSSGDVATQWSAWAERRFRTASQPATGGPITWSVRQPGYQVEVFATGFELPVNIAFVPNPGPKANDVYLYVTELYGTIKVVTRDGTVSDYLRGALNYRPSGIFPGSGEQGLAGIVVEPVSGDVFASMLYDPDGIEGGPKYPKVVRYESHTSGRVSNKSTKILEMPGEEQGQSHQISNLSIGPDGKLYVHMGDGFDLATAQNLNSFRGKILRMNLDGSAPSDNPFYNASDSINAKDYVYAYGFRNPFGGIWRASDNFHYSVENGPGVDRFAKIVQGRNYLWDGSDASMRNYALYNWSPAAAPVNIAFIQPETFSGSGFPAGKMGHAFVSESGPTWAEGPQGIYGKRISEFVLDANGNLASGPTSLLEYTGTGKATVAGLAAGPDGLYFTDLYVDQRFDTAVARGANIFRVKYIGTNTLPSVNITSPTNGGSFTAPATITIDAAATDSDGTVSKVEFFEGATKLGEDTTTPYSYTWNTVAPGTYQLTAKATDNLGATSTSSAVNITVSGAPPTPIGSGTGLNGEYYDNLDFTLLKVTRTDPTVNFDWGGGSPDTTLGPDTFSVKWVGQVQPRYSATYTFYIVSDDGVRLWVNGQLVIDNWTDHAPTENLGSIALVAGQKYDIRIEYYEYGGGAVAQLLWSSASQPKQIIPQSQLYPPPTP